MIREAIEYLKKEFVDGAGPNLIHFKGDPPHIYRTKTPDGEIKVVETELPHVRPIVDNLADAVRLFKHMRGPASAVFFTHNAVRFVPNMFDGRPGIVVPLQTTAAWRHLRAMEINPDLQAMEPDAFKRLLEIEWRCCAQTDKLLEKVSTLNVRNGKVEGRTAGRTKESFSSDVLSEVVGEMPNTLQVFRFRRFLDSALADQWHVEFRLETIKELGQWVLTPIPDSIESADRAIGMQLWTWLHEHVNPAKDGNGPEPVHVPIYNGTYSDPNYVE